MNDLVNKIKDHEKNRLLEISKKYKDENYKNIISELVSQYENIISKTIFDLQADEVSIKFNLLNENEKYKKQAGIYLHNRYRKILEANKRNIY